jgi:hypothetical protein
MSKPWIHAKSSARRYGGVPEDYMEIHQMMDSSKSSMPDGRHRALTHNSWFIGADGPLEKIFGVVITNSEGKEVSVRDLGEQHILEDFGMRFIPSVSDYLGEMEYKHWMNNGKGDEVPPSHKKIAANKVTRTIKLIESD